MQENASSRAAVATATTTTIATIEKLAHPHIYNPMLLHPTNHFIPITSPRMSTQIYIFPYTLHIRRQSRAYTKMHIESFAFSISFSYTQKYVYRIENI